MGDQGGVFVQGAVEVYDQVNAKVHDHDASTRPRLERSDQWLDGHGHDVDHDHVDGSGRDHGRSRYDHAHVLYRTPATTSAPQPKSSNTPPNGVIAPSARVPVSVIA